MRYENRGFVVWIAGDLFERWGPVRRLKKKLAYLFTPTVDNNHGSIYKRTNAHICAGITSYTGVTGRFVKGKKNAQYLSTTGKIVGRWKNRIRIINLFFFPPARRLHDNNNNSRRHTNAGAYGHNKQQNVVVVVVVVNQSTGIMVRGTCRDGRCWYTRVYITCHRHVTHMCVVTLTNDIFHLFYYCYFRNIRVVSCAHGPTGRKIMAADGWGKKTKNKYDNNNNSNNNAYKGNKLWFPARTAQVNISHLAPSHHTITVRMCVRSQWRGQPVSSSSHQYCSAILSTLENPTLHLTSIIVTQCYGRVVGETRWIEKTGLIRQSNVRRRYVSFGRVVLSWLRCRHNMQNDR